MDDLFRFVALRAGERVQPDHLTGLATDSRFQAALAGIHHATEPPPPAKFNPGGP